LSGFEKHLSALGSESLDLIRRQPPFCSNPRDLDSFLSDVSQMFHFYYILFRCPYPLSLF